MFFNQFHLVTKIKVRIVGRANGLSRDDVGTVVDGISDRRDFAAIGQAYETQTGKKLPTEEDWQAHANGETRGAVTDFLQWLIQWASSPEGMAFIKFIFSMFGFAML